MIVADINYAVGVTRFLLDDLGWIPALPQFTEIPTPEQQERLAAKLEGGALNREGDNNERGNTIRPIGGRRGQHGRRQGGGAFKPGGGGKG
jgi:hypothetical protein